MITDLKKEQIALEVIRVLKKRFDEFPTDLVSDNRNAPFHKAFLQAFSQKLNEHVKSIPVFIGLSSWMHGLNTSLGQSFFERVAHKLSGGQKRGFTSEKRTRLTVTEVQKATIADIITDLKNGNKHPDVVSENSLLRTQILLGHEIDANDFTCDVYFEDNDRITAIELKSVRPNAGESRGEKQKILEAKAALFKHFPHKEISYYVGFPFDPTDNTPTGFDKKRFLEYLIDGTKYFDSEEVLLSSELWDFLSGEKNTMETILEIINRIASPKFLQRFEYINNSSNRYQKPRYYRKILEKWCLFSELHLFDNDALICRNLTTDVKERKYNQSNIFKKNGYDESRFNELKIA
ncbi:MjaII restriction endonuclease [Candidatus Moduliflexus flocculans]|uniref:type II site-specific deoxyribonuclease n=1 Tax=Candidatus Moduliflexus flocculans TaxID=1499966 RepID=A0A081BT58_9BACT|nr:MjaII restriction endonuclease [Candidatus Moduliflexus flocculans]